MRYRAAVVGCGKIGSQFADDPLMAGDVFTHAEAYARSPATELVAVCDPDDARRAACGERWGVESRFAAVEELLRAARPEIVSVATPDDTHPAVVRQILEHGPSVRAILCEKPLARSTAEAASLAELARARGVELAVVYMRRFAQNVRAVRRLVESGELGAVQAVTGWYGKGVLHNGSHWFDLLRFLAGEVEWVSAVDVLREGGADPTLDVLLGMRGGALATLRASRAGTFTLFEMDLLLERGRVQLLDSAHEVRLWRAAPSPRYSGYTELVPEPSDLGHRRDLMLHAVDDLAAALREGRRPACTAADGVEAVRIGHAALEAARTGGRCSLHR